jgi:hypothetical protein
MLRTEHREQYFAKKKLVTGDYRKLHDKELHNFSSNIIRVDQGAYMEENGN